MELERIRPTVLRATFHAYELAALISAARYVVASAPGELPEESRRQLTAVLDSYDNQVRRLTQTRSPQGQGG